MLFLNLLIAKLISNLLQILDSLDGFLCKFTDIHRLTLLLYEKYFSRKLRPTDTTKICIVYLLIIHG